MCDQQSNIQTLTEVASTYTKATPFQRLEAEGVPTPAPCRELPLLLLVVVVLLLLLTVGPATAAHMNPVAPKMDVAINERKSANLMVLFM